MTRFPAVRAKLKGILAWIREKQYFPCCVEESEK